MDVVDLRRHTIGVKLAVDQNILLAGPLPAVTTTGSRHLAIPTAPNGSASHFGGHEFLTGDEAVHVRHILTSVREPTGPGQRSRLL